MKYAVIQFQGKQYRVESGMRFDVPHLPDAAEQVVVQDVLLFVDGESVEVGQPLLKKHTVTLKVLSEQKGDKIRVAKYRSKSRYRRYPPSRPP
jgi:large subunit ribosomal protein L21